MMIPYPEDDYLLLLGKATYSVSYFEWLVLGNLGQIVGLPQEFALENLAGKSTGQIANALRQKSALGKITDPKLVSWLACAADHLEAVSKKRNAILHARPATIGPHQRLNRWDPTRNEAFVIDDETLKKFIADIDQRIADMNSRRLI